MDPTCTRQVTWSETVTAPTLASTLRITRDNPGELIIALGSFNGALDLSDAFRRPLHRRGRFLREPTTLGSFRFSTGTGTLATARPLHAEPSPSVRWPGRATILVDEMTYSAAEDFVFGLQGLEHITVLGSPTGGGSGRPRVIPLFDDLILTVSTALTYDRTGHCIELNGLPVDGPIN